MRRMEPEERKLELLEFGRTHFAFHGYDALSVDEIATRAEVSKGTIYNYFGGRRGFYLATISAVIDDLLVAIEPPPDQPLEQVLPRMMRAFVEYASEHDGIYLAIVRGGLGADVEVSEMLERVRHTAAAHVYQALGETSPSSRRALAVSGWVAFVEATTAQWLGARPIALAALVDMFIQNLLALLEQNA